MNNHILINNKDMLSIGFRGQSDDTITSHLIGLSELYLQSSLSLTNLRKKASILIIESLQNILRHGVHASLKKDTTSEKDFFQINISSDRITISSKNMVENEHVTKLNDKIDAINQLNKEELKSAWRHYIQKGKLSSKGGAGLGIIEMARKSGLPLKKMFVKLDENYSQFFLGIELSNNKDDSATQFDIADAADQYQEFTDSGINLLYNGEFSGETNAILIEMLHNNFIDEDNIDSKVVENVSIMIELIQNVSKHGAFYNDRNAGIFCIYEENGTQHITCQNYVDPQNYAEFKDLLDSVKTKDTKELKRERKKKMLNDALSSQGNGGLGLLEIGLFTDSEFNYSFERTDTGYYLFSIELKLRIHG